MIDTSIFQKQMMELDTQISQLSLSWLHQLNYSYNRSSIKHRESNYLRRIRRFCITKATAVSYIEVALPPRPCIVIEVENASTSEKILYGSRERILVPFLARTYPSERDRERDIEREVAAAMISVSARIARGDNSGRLHG